jgi:hypothetical protein
MLQLENPQDQAMDYALNIHLVNVQKDTNDAGEVDWCGVLMPQDVMLATDPLNPLQKYY